jgi:formylglycine-generating enzyme required for sulfatase activity
MKRAVISLFSLLLVSAAGVTGAYAQKPKLAVLVVGMESNAKGDSHAKYLGNDLNRDNKYDLQTKDNNPAVALKLATLRGQSTPVDTTGIAKWGKSNGIDFVQLVVEDSTAIVAPIEQLKGVEVVAQLVDCNTGKLSGRGTYRMQFTPKGVKPTFVMVPVTGGIFRMGYMSGRDGTNEFDNGEEPLHYVKVNDFSIGKYPVTQRLWRAVMGSLPSEITDDHKGDEKPVTWISYDDITSDSGFLAKLNALTGQRYRLPTEAEWEYAARGCNAGSCESYEYSGSNAINDVGWYNSYNSPNYGPQPVGRKSPNGLGIYDMSGNVYEWCSDWYSNKAYPSGTTAANPQDNPTGPKSGYNRVRRGGSWGDFFATFCRVAYREGGTLGFDSDGFRLV